MFISAYRHVLKPHLLSNMVLRCHVVVQLALLREDLPILEHRGPLAVVVVEVRTLEHIVAEQRHGSHLTYLGIDAR